jgi:alkylated DNA nucleotide flippase Atl1
LAPDKHEGETVASRTQVILISDLSGEEVGAGGDTVNFSYRDVGYSIDLSAKEARAFDKAMAMYIEHAQRKSGQRIIGNMRRHKPPRDRERLQAAREWLRANGYQVSDRGRIKAELMDLYNQHH